MWAGVLLKDFCPPKQKTEIDKGMTRKQYLMSLKKEQMTIRSHHEKIPPKSDK